MARDKIDAARGLIMFVIAWLLGVYVYEIVQEAFHGSIGLVAAVFTVLVNIYARKKAAACAGANLWFRFWLFLPVILFFAVPIAVKVTLFLTSNAERSWLDYVVSLLPFVLKIGVPVGTLLWAYVAMGSMAPSKAGNSGDIHINC